MADTHLITQRKYQFFDVEREKRGTEVRERKEREKREKEERWRRDGGEMERGRGRGRLIHAQ